MTKWNFIDLLLQFTLQCFCQWDYRWFFLSFWWLDIFNKFPIIQLGAIFLGNSSFFFFIHDISSRWFLFFFFFLQTHLKLNFVHIQLTFVKLISINLIRKFADTTHESQECKWKLFKSITTLIISREIRQDVHSLSDDCIV